MKSLSYIFLASSLVTGLVAGCEKKEKALSDPGPQFSVTSQAIRFGILGPATVNLKRDDPYSGPLVQLQPHLITSVKKSERRIICPNLKPFEGRKAYSPDMSVFSFKIAEEEFPGLSQLPLISVCKLEATLTNQIGSTMTRQIPITIRFDVQPHLIIARSSLARGSIHQSLFEKNNLKLLEYAIENRSELPVAFIFRPRQKILARVSYSLATAAPDGALKLSVTRYSRDLLDLSATQIVLSHNAFEVSGNFADEVRFKAPPHSRVRVAAFTHIPEAYTVRTTVGGVQEPELPGANAFTRSFTGIYIVRAIASSEERALFLARGLEISEIDLKNPISAAFIDRGPLYPSELNPQVDNMLIRF